MLKNILTATLLLFCLGAFSQNKNSISEENLVKLHAYEDTLQFLGDTMIQSQHWEIRELATVRFVKTMVQALKIENSYLYPFDSLKTISIIKPEDNSFRIMTWQLTMKDRTYRYYGTIQMNNPQLKMFPLIDMSLFIKNPQDTLLNNNNWYGSIYYNIVKKKYKRQDYYLLFGWDGNDMFSNKKIVDVLRFDQMGTPIFGDPIFLYKDDPDPKTRIIIEYKEDASPVCNYDDHFKMIIISYLRPENPMSEGIYMTYIPDGTYVGFYFKKGLWRFQEKVFDHVMDAPPDYTPQRQGDDPNMYQH